MSDSKDSTVTYITALPSPDYVPGPEEPKQAPRSPVYIPYVPEPEYPEYIPPEDEVFPAEEQPLPAAALPTTDSPGYILESDPDKDPEDDDDEDPEEDPADYPADHDDEEEEEPFGDDVDEEDEEQDEDDDDEEEEHPASADSIPPLPALRLLSSDRRADRPEVTLPHRKRLSIVHYPGYEAGESSAAAVARPIEGRRADYGFVDSVEAEIRRRIAEDIGYGDRACCSTRAGHLGHLRSDRGHSRSIRPEALGFQNPCYLKKAQQLKPNLYDGSVIGKSDVVVVPDSEETLMLAEESLKERTTATAITEGTWGFEHTKACFCDVIIPFVKNLKELSTSFDQCLIDEVTKVQNIFKQMELAVEQHCAEKTKFKTKMENVLKENDRLLTQALSVEIVNIVVHDNVKFDCLNVDACVHCVTTESELKSNFIKKECYEMLLQQYHILETHCISLEVNNQLNMEIFQRDTVSSPESAPTFAELFEINELKAQVQEKDTVILKLKEKLKSFSGDVKDRKVKREVEEIETLNLELDHKVTKLAAENEHLKQTYKQLFDSIKSLCVQSKEHCDELINKVNLKSVKVSYLNASLQEKVLVITALKEQLNTLKGKAVLTEAVSLKPIEPTLLQVDVAPLVPKLRKNRTAHTDYIRHTQEEAATLREIVESKRLLSPLNTSLAYACKYTRRIQELLMILQKPVLALLI
nr:hypothetical protein [Tanacetum cinerariifolium]